MSGPRELPVRAYRSTDLHAVLDLFQRSVLQLAARDYSDAQLAAWAPASPDLEVWRERLSTGGVFVYERPNALAGFARIDAAGTVDVLYVDPDCTRQGVATALMRELYAWARQHGIERLYADVSKTALPFFEQEGFRVRTRQTVERRGVRLQNFRMERDVGSA
jgi:putative acetyltransferase